MGLDSLASPAGLSHMRLELETWAPGLERERAHSGGPGRWGLGGRLDLTFQLVRPQAHASLCPTCGAPRCPPRGAGAASMGSQAGPTLFARTIWNFRQEAGRVAPLAPHLAPSTQPHRPPGTFLSPSHACCFPPPSSTPSTGTFPRDAYSPEDVHGPLP